MEYNFDSLKNKNILITGGSGAIGLSIARGFKTVDANVMLWGHREIDSEIVKEFQRYQVVELEDKAELEKAFADLIETCHKIDVLVNCAGYTVGNKSEKYDYKDWEKTIAVNLTAPFLLSQLIALNMIESSIEGSIINITSIGAEMGFPENPAYVASKGGLKQLTKGLAYDWAQYGIRVNNVGPGYTRTKMTQGSWNNEETRQLRSEHTLLRRWAKPEDLVGAVLFLSSDMASYITGQDIYVDGGWTAKGI